MAHHINDYRMTSITSNCFKNLFEFLQDWCGIKIHKLNTIQTDAPTWIIKYFCVAFYPICSKHNKDSPGTRIWARLMGVVLRVGSYAYTSLATTPLTQCWAEVEKKTTRWSKYTLKLSQIPRVITNHEPKSNSHVLEAKRRNNRTLKLSF